ncbi:glycosyltransferase family 2 protein [Intrasporangium calvum]|uniref:Glycosyl transferase family 2 n=1 Tax=Intrasporangium calvum (strain ATCC 23552 / DSM 43043 / JCM 3097 / NBRC 12989 / NCIMB 10167 / NRRL B-3866 / 7 KIP) TaxID=710696 RepID=E6S8H8_INTC7|nr:glycosyl transferase family 2 [Intrasporangium calvum DSM 43043]
MTAQYWNTRDSVSVILPYFNRPATLTTAVNSVLSQTHGELILYLVDDASTDDSRCVAKGIRDRRIRHIDAPTNMGPSGARNLGLREAETALVAFMDSDDEWLPTKLETQIRKLRAIQSGGRPVSVMGCGWRYSGRDVPASRFVPGPFSRMDMLRGVAGTGTPMLLVDRCVAAPPVKFDGSFPSLEERDFVLACLANDSLLAVVPENLAIVTRGRKDHVANPELAAAAWERYLVKYSSDLHLDEGLNGWYHYRAARENLIAGNRRRAFRLAPMALKDQPLRRATHLTLGLFGRSRGFAVAQRLFPL